MKEAMNVAFKLEDQMASYCKCCNKKIGVLNISKTLGHKFDEPVCEKCFSLLNSPLEELNFAVTKIEEENARKLVMDIINGDSFSENGKQYALDCLELLIKEVDAKIEYYESSKTDEEKKADQETEDKIREWREKEKIQEEKNREQKSKIDHALKVHKLTTGYSFEGFKIIAYGGIVTGSVVLGTGLLSEFSAGISDILGMKTNAFSKKLEEAKDLAVREMMIKSIMKSCNATIGVDFDYITLGSNMIGVVANGTCVTIEPIIR